MFDLLEHALSRAASRFSTACHFFPPTPHYETYCSSLVTLGEADGERERGLERTSSKTHLGGLITNKLCLISTGSYVRRGGERSLQRSRNVSVCVWKHTVTCCLPLSSHSGNLAAESEWIKSLPPPSLTTDEVLLSKALNLWPFWCPISYLRSNHTQ